MTPEQKAQIFRLAAEWSMTSFLRGIDNGKTEEPADADRAAADAFYAYMDGLSK